MNCGPSEKHCKGEKRIPCRCMCDGCEQHEMECQGCVNCDLESDGHVWIDGLDPRWLICEVHSDEAMVRAA